MKKISLLAVLALFLVCSVNAVVIDEANITTPKLHNAIDDLDSDILVYIKKTSLDLYADSDNIFTAKNPYLMISYQADNKKMYVLKSKQKTYDEESLSDIIARYKEKKNAIRTQEDINEFLSDFASELNSITAKREYSDEDLTYCTNIKDGFCDKDCPVVDIDCYCPDNICQSFETPNTCQSDCMQKIKPTCTFLPDGICQNECFLVDIDCKVLGYSVLAADYYDTNKQKYNIILFASYGLLFISFSVLIFLAIKYRRRSRS